MDEMKKIIGVDEMHKWSGEMAEQLKQGEVLLLKGPLGSGKTTFTQGLAKALGIKEPVTSPTFNVVAEYEVAGAGEIKKLVHIDLYRLSAAEAKEEGAVLEALQTAGENGRVTLVEWADRLGDNVPAGAQEISFEYGQDTKERLVTIKRPNSRGSRHRGLLTSTLRLRSG